MKKIKILQIINDFEVGGVQNFVLDLVNSNSYKDFDNEILCIDRSSGKSVDLFSNRFNSIYQNRLIFQDKNKRPYRFWKFFRRFRVALSGYKLDSLFKKINPDIIHSHIMTGLHWQLLASKKNNIPIIISFHGTVELTKKEKLSIKSYPDKLSIVCDSMNTWKSSIPYIDKVTIIPTGIRTDNKATFNRSKARKKIHVPDDYFLLGSVGRIHPVKGFDILIQAAKLVIKQNKKIIFCVAGQGNQKEILEQLVIESGLKDNFFFLGYYEQIEEFYSALDGFILPSRSEGLPLSVIEAMFISLPVIATDVGGVKELLLDGKAGLVIPPEDPVEMANAIIVLLSDSKLREKFGRISQERSLDFSIENCSRSYVNLYQEFINLEIFNKQV